MLVAKKKSQRGDSTHLIQYVYFTSRKNKLKYVNVLPVFNIYQRG